MDERRTGWVLIVVLVAQLVFLAIQGGRAGETRAEKLGLRLLGPLARTVAAIPRSLITELPLEDHSKGRRAAPSPWLAVKAR